MTASIFLWIYFSFVVFGIITTLAGVSSIVFFDFCGFVETFIENPAFLVSYGTRCVFQMVFPPLFKGVSVMRRKVLMPIVFTLLGGISTMPISSITNWWNAPPTPPSVEAEWLVDSLEKADGWVIDKPEGSSRTRWVHKGDIFIHPCDVWADVSVSNAKVNDQFTNKDLRAIHHAAEKCLRRLTVHSVVKVVSTTVADNK
jgi:hypothetical protein